MKGPSPTCLDVAQKKGWNWDEFVKNDHDGYVVCRQQANTEQCGVCGYTELSLDENVMVHLDHFRKKDIYPKLRFKWDNLFAAAKDNRFGSDFKDRIVTGKNYNQVYANILSPKTVGLQDYFHYATNGEIEPSTTLSEDNEKKAKETIRIFNLNEAELVNRRRTMMIQIAGYEDLTEEVIRSCFEGYGFPSVLDQEIHYLFAQ